MIERVGGDLELTVRGIGKEDVGVYAVHASNPSGDAKCYAGIQLQPKSSSSSTAIIKPQQEQRPPEFRKPLLDILVSTGQPVKLECFIKGKPQPKVSLFAL